MKKACLILNAIMLLLLFTGKAVAQAPERISYQAVVRNALNELVKETGIGVQISILQGSPTGSAVYVERHFPATSAAGLVTLEIGSGSVISGSFASIDWPAGTYYLKCEIDPNGGTSFTITGTSQILSVPYALYSKKAGSYTETDPVWTASSADYYSKTNLQTAGQSQVDWGNLVNTDPDIADLADGLLSGSKVGTGISAANISTGVLTITNGGTGATTASSARTNLGLGALATLDAVTTAQITNSTITAADIAVDGITATNIAASAVGPSEIATDAVGADEILAGAVGSPEIADNSITTADVSSLDAYKISGITANFIPRSDGTGLYPGSIFDNGLNLGIGNSWSGNTKLYINSNETGISYGIFAYSSGSETNNYSIHGVALNASTGNYALHGVSQSSSTGPSTGYGVYGYAYGTGINNGVYGRASGGSSNWAGYFSDGNVHISNQVEAPNLAAASATAEGLVIEGGWIKKVFSDMRLKENIEPLSDILGKVLELKSVSFTWRSDSTHTHDIGFLAQDVQKVFPELVVQDQSSGLLSVKYMNMTAVLVEAIREQQKEIEAAKQQNNELLEMVRLLQKRLDVIESGNPEGGM